MIYCFLADGFEEIEALSVVDILKRGEVEIKTVAVSGEVITGAHGIRVVPDIKENDILLDSNFEGVILPGGMPGTLNLQKSDAVLSAVDYACRNDRYVCAICAAPLILGGLGVLNNKNAVCFPGFENELTGAKLSSDYVVTDGKIITAKGAGVAHDFAFEILSKLKSTELAQKIKSAMQSK